MARKLVIFDTTTREIMQVAPYDAKAAVSQAWLSSLANEGLSFVDVDNVTSPSEFYDRTVDASVAEKSVHPTITKPPSPVSRAEYPTSVLASPRDFPHSRSHEESSFTRKALCACSGTNAMPVSRRPPSDVWRIS